MRCRMGALASAREGKKLAVAWGDESIRQSADGQSMYLMGACVCDSGEADVRRVLGTVKPKGAPKLHWRDMKRTLRNRSIDAIDAMSLSHVVVAAVPMSDWTNSERARRKCMEQLLPVLENEYGVDRFVLESRDKDQDKRDIRLVDALRSRKFVSDIRIDLKRGEEDARLWLPDQLLGAYGDSESGSRDFDAFLSDVKVSFVPSD